MGKGTGHGQGSGEGKGQGGGDGAGAYKGKSERIAVPAMPMPMAVICCILNFLIPGFGTILAGFSNFCCSRNEDIDNAARGVSCLMNWGIGCLQLITAVLCLVGFCWSWAWGIFFIGMSADYYHNNRVDDTDRGRGAGVVVHQPQALIITNAQQPGTHGQHVVTLNQPPGPRFGGQVIATGSHMTMVQQPGNQPMGAMQPPPAYSGPPSKPTNEQLYPPVPPPAYQPGNAYPGTSDPAYPSDQTKVAL